MLRRQTEQPARSAVDVAAAYDAAQCVVEAHRRLSRWLHAGLTLPEVDRFIAETLEALDCKSCFLNYAITGLPPFPSHACLSLNSCVVHGTHDSHREPLAVGDVLKVDIGVAHHGWIGDAARTYIIGEPSPDVRRLLETSKESLRRGVTKLQPGSPLIDWARTVQNYVERERGYALVTGLGGHGYGRVLHTDPYVSNVVPFRLRDWPDAHRRLVPGMLLAVEPMICVGTGKTVQRRGLWPVYSADGSQSVHHEHNVLITENGPRVLSEGLDDVPDIITR